MRFVHRLSVAAATAVAFTAGLNAGTVMITTDTTVGCEDMSLDGMDVIVDGAILTIDCDHTFNSLMLINNGVVTHSVGGAIPSGESDAVGLHLTITNDCTITGGCLIRANLRGHEPASGPGAGGTDDVAGGGAHGGAGGDGNGSYSDAIGGAGYGDLHAPTTFGSGGGNDDSPGVNGGRGGGAIRLTVGGQCDVSGTIAANGGDFNGNESGGGAGGSIWIDCNELAGDGDINARGGIGHAAWSGGGGGGRIAIYANTSVFAGGTSAYGGSGTWDGGAGTILMSINGVEDLFLDNMGHNRPSPTDFVGTTTINGNATLTNGAFLGHPKGEQGVVFVVTGDMFCDATSGIDVAGSGYGPDGGPAPGLPDLQVAGGAGHGGAGGNGNASYVNAFGGGCYGSIEMPTTHGSGGGTDPDNLSPGGDGGGAFHCTVGGTFTLDGVADADGFLGSNLEAGGGAGGSLWIEAGVLTGTGTIRANGGSANATYAGAGGGGRIAVYTGTDTFTGTMSACGGSGRHDGGAGTIYAVDTSSGDATLLLDNCSHNAGEATELTGMTTIVADVTIRNSAFFGHAHEDDGLDVTIDGHCTIEETGAISLDGRGFPADAGPQPGQQGSQVSGGAGHGGAGANGNIAYPNAIGGDCYGSVEMPTTFGSGGGTDPDQGDVGGSGGGAIHLTVTETLTVDGVISANGLAGGSHEPGAGAGGSIWIDCGTLAGIGSINADGGAANATYSGGGGGGRIAITYDTDAFTTARGDGFPITACGGNGRFDGGAGTIYLKDNATSLGTVIVANCNHNAGEATEFSGYNAYNAGLIVRDAGLVSHKHEAEGTHIDFAGDILVEETGVIGGNGRGWPHESGPGAGEAGIVTAGAGHGGAGGNANPSYPARGGGCYGSVESPVTLGSGAGDDTDESSLGGAGGPALRITCGSRFIVNGVVSADGDPGAGQCGGGSGGSLWIETSELSGTGTIRAHGGAGNATWAGGGGGGRISISYDLNTLAPERGVGTGAITACGGNARNDGGAGTIYLINNTTMEETMIVDNCDNNVGEATEFSGTHTFDSNLLVRNAGLLGHPHNEAGMHLTFTGDVDVEAGGIIGGVGRGWPGGMGPGAGGEDAVGGGGGHGGTGGSGHPNYPGATPGPAYGSFEMPVTLGSGGGNDTDNNVPGGAGGGALRLTVGGDVHVDGEINLDGAAYPSGHAGGGAGGSLWIECNDFTGTGSVTARGGGGHLSWSGGGGGGRIVIQNTAASFTGLVSACGGDGQEDGGQGTAFINAAFACPGDTNCDLTVDFDDLNVLLDYWGQVNSRGDLNGDGVVNFTDLEILLEAWGTFCS